MPLVSHYNHLLQMVRCASVILFYSRQREEHKGVLSVRPIFMHGRQIDYQGMNVVRDQSSRFEK